MDRKILINKYLNFFKEKNHKVIPSSSLIPENDSTVLFTTAGMQPLVPNLLGEKHPQGNRLVGVQKCLRTGDIDEVGDSFHHTFFEMLGNWSLGNYWKEESIKYSFEFLIDILKLDKNRLAVSVFKGNSKISRDDKSAKFWKKMGMDENRIIYLSEKDNWWGPVGNKGPCGPDTEIFYYVGKEVPKIFNSDDKNWVEIWNNVFMEYNKDEKGKYNLAPQKNVDTGMGVERTVAVLEGLDDNYLAGNWLPIIRKIEKISGKKYEENKREMRIIADHIKASVFIIGDGVLPSNVEQGYVLRRLIRRAVVNLNRINSKKISELYKIAEPVFEIYEDYDNLIKNKKEILEQIKKEEEKFEKTLEKGLRKFERISKKGKIDGRESFLLFQSYGFPIEMTRELANENGIKVDLEEFNKFFKRHQELSRTATAGKFKSGLADNSEKTTKLHTAAHLLNEALRIVLKKPDLSQRGSNITSERLRFDFNFDRKLTDEEVKEIENLINLKIKESLPVKHEIMNLEEARKNGASGVFDSKYGKDVKVYTIEDPKSKRGWFSKEICAGPHVKNTSELGKFKIIKQDSCGAGIRRIKAILE
jgi:alanyl-tRNA synthetase